MSRTGTLHQRCTACRMSKHLCICSLVPRIELKTKIIVLMHWRESFLTTNTANLACLALPNSEIRLRGEMASYPSARRSSELAPFDPTSSAILFPAENAIELNEQTLQKFSKPMTLIVPDGSWRQAQRIPNREASIKGLPRFRLPPGPPSRFRLRYSPHEQNISTFEAIARALGILEGPEVQKQLEEIFLVMVERVLWARGKLSAKDCATGIPVEAFEKARLAGIEGGPKKGWKNLSKKNAFE